MLRSNNYFGISLNSPALAVATALFLPTMYLVAIAWIYVALMMAVAEATNTNGTVLGAIFTFIIYGLIPVSIVVYLMRTPARNRERKARERAEWVEQQNAMAAADAPREGDAPSPAAAQTISSSVSQPDTGSHAPGAAQPGSVAPVRKEL
jgi:hypothetical protein